MEIDKDSSPIAVMGYVTGAKGANRWRRREILRTAIEEHWRPSIRREVPADQLAEWGLPGKDRYLKLTTKLRSQIENARSQRNRSSYRDAIREWQEDLDWVREQFGPRFDDPA